MGAVTGIEWCHHTFNPWRGCTHVSPGCEHCYAETLAKRNPGLLGTWGAGGTRVIASEAMWRQPLRWNREAAAAGERRRVFCSSLADVFEDRPELVAPRRRLMELIEVTPNLDWLLLTKRPENVAWMALADYGDGLDHFPNVWLGVSVEDQRRADERIPLLLETPVAVRFLSCEPLLGPVDIAHHVYHLTVLHEVLPRVDWVIVGGESGPGARPMDIAWARSLVQQCTEEGVPVFVKQLGARPTARGYLPPLRDRKGGDPDEWPNELRVRQFPGGAS